MTSPDDSARIARTNGDLVAAMVRAGGEHLAALRAYAIAHPDELAAAAAPLLLLLVVTRRYRLTFTEAALISQLGYWGGVLALRQYRAWKAEPLDQPARLTRIG